MNFNIITEAGNGEMTYDKATDVRPSVYLSLSIVAESTRIRGSWPMFPDFGLDLSDIDQVTDEKVALFKQRLENALLWLVDALKAIRIDVTTERDSLDRNRINANIEVIQLNQIPMIFVAFVCVGGPSPGFTVT